MKMAGTKFPRPAGWIGLACLLMALLPGCAQEEEVRYSWHVQPILEKNCLSCHQPGGQGYEASGFSMVSYDDLMKGTKFGPMEGRADPSISMPHGSMEPVSREEIETIRRWIDQGAKNN